MLSSNAAFVPFSQSYDAEFLKIYSKLSPAPLQLEEDLEQLKVLENGYKIKVLHAQTFEPSTEPSLWKLIVFFFCLLRQVINVDHHAHGVDTPEDVEKIESFMRERNLS